ncbi:hypothetical protein PHYBLDRAFT_162242 [Phycomyces blakesleeanus NRRL 1555(-)]|uniref:Uncharacterized protein n=1 Tax=Phycomyces blakesleeanus (strain ATCC 8743b / DSM 1359 / FGSC 10004 / NBRC 33097 / NRRL 1555) TaxID=763407 RepID=A0A167Q6M3_PHYB8|nr:hypothetical protein PHYBLDRAFT_162242 [Phycomyces blakesleeanus NRRL 1555(-)]OAD79164.1 hypothetical protein PHYBLDRAFT_162242 [Phycomyces blakesleeanus NRRL 1555(-)]|eukprot:XP_018297204.1 hypothetical protein PHYBLDRAFT_162242 [Phycomyces blakesleeanus NRRL 1555(-)]
MVKKKDDFIQSAVKPEMWGNPTSDNSSSNFKQKPIVPMSQYSALSSALLLGIYMCVCDVLKADFLVFPELKLPVLSVGSQMPVQKLKGQKCPKDGHSNAKKKKCTSDLGKCFLEIQSNKGSVSESP